MKSFSEETGQNYTFIGSFGSENYMRDENLAKLPEIPDEQANNIILSMDELQFVFCKKNDVIITRYAMDESHMAYLNEIGFGFSNNKCDVAQRSCNDKVVKNKSVIHLMTETEDKDYLKKLIAPKSNLSPFAIIPYADELAKEYEMNFQSPAMDVIRRVNSKAYSTHLKDVLEINNISRIALNCEELLNIGTEILKNSLLIIKDEFGVSGKGNLLINSDVTLNRIVSYLQGQEKKGKDVRFILEPFLEKDIDFSCQFYITESGNFKLLSIQRILNNEFAYQGSFTVGDKLMNLLEKSGYIKIMEISAQALYKEGYFGHVCIDSMVLKNSEVVPIVEVNARKSMSLLKHYVDNYLEELSLEGSLSNFSVTYRNTISYEGFLKELRNFNLLFEPNMKSGIMPLTANSLFINREANIAVNNQSNYKGRLYFAAVSQNMNGILDIIQELREFMAKLEFKIHN